MTVQVKFKQYVQGMVTDGGTTVRRGVKDHSLHNAGRRLRSTASIIYCYQLPGRVRVWPTHTLRRKSGRHKAVEVWTRVIGFFFLGLPHTASAAVAAMICALQYGDSV